jgi:hypothetical protein
VDWNGDGRKDLITGEYNGTVRIYLNTNTDEEPVFSGFEYLMVGGLPFDVGNYSAVCPADWNNDGLIDVLAGDSVGKVWLLVNAGTPGNPLFTGYSHIQNNGTDLSVAGNACPSVEDWNRDGKKDLVIGETNGTLVYFENKGADADPVFNGSLKLKTGYAPGNFTIDLGADVRLDLVDWDGDGVLDILAGETSGYVHLLRGIGPLHLGQNRIPDSTGASIGMELIAGSANAGRTYLMLAGVTGTEPGFTLPGGEVLPLNWDPFTDVALGLLNSPLFSHFLGSLDAEGKGLATLNAPANTGYPGVSLYFAYCLGNPFNYTSNGAAVEIVP